MVVVHVGGLVMVVLVLVCGGSGGAVGSHGGD